MISSGPSLTRTTKTSHDDLRLREPSEGIFMKSLFAALVALTLSLLSSIASGQETTVTPERKLEIEKIVHDYLIEHPEVIRQAIQALQAKDEQDKADARTQVV